MPYLHWATSGESLNHRNEVIKRLDEEFKDRDYQRPSYEDIERMESLMKMRVLRAFLYPIGDRCLHIRRTLDQYYYSTLTEADERTEDQVVYKFAKKQHRKRMEEEAKAKEREREKVRKVQTLRGSQNSLKTTDEREKQEKKKVEPSWDPPKVMMVNQLWMWIVDGGEDY
jgi:hypothetical protein